MWQWKRNVYSGVAEYFLEKGRDNLRAGLTQITVLQEKIVRLPID
jgi:hypothetical protein